MARLNCPLYLYGSLTAMDQNRCRLPGGDLEVDEDGLEINPTIFTLLNTHTVL
jgi:hypothetical protein